MRLPNVIDSIVLGTQTALKVLGAAFPATMVVG